MPTFKTPEPPKERKVMPPTDIVWQITKFEIGIAATKGPTNGCEKYTVEFFAEGHDVRWEEELYDHETCLWKVNAMLKSGGVKLIDGEPYEFPKDIAESKGVRWINPIGLRGHGRTKLEKYPKRGEPTERTQMSKWTGEKVRMDIFYTDKPALPRVEGTEEENPFA